jgi:hypothetical protein
MDMAATLYAIGIGEFGNLSGRNGRIANISNARRMPQRRVWALKILPKHEHRGKRTSNERSGEDL